MSTIGPKPRPPCTPAEAAEALLAGLEEFQGPDRTVAISYRGVWDEQRCLPCLIRPDEIEALRYALLAATTTPGRLMAWMIRALDRLSEPKKGGAT